MYKPKGEDSIKNFKLLLNAMYDGFPNGFHGLVDYVIKNKQLIDVLEKNGYLIKSSLEKSENIPPYILGPNAIALVVAWRTEDLTKRIEFLTGLLSLLTFILIGLTVGMLVKMYWG